MEPSLDQPDLNRTTLDDLLDSAVLRHGFAAHNRDYQFILEVIWTGEWAGQYLLTFTHCFEAHYSSVVTPETLRVSWDDLNLDHRAFYEKGGDGFVWGTNWSLAYPGFHVVPDSAKAQSWSEVVGRKMQEAVFETNAFKLNLIFHAWKLTKLNKEHGLVDQYIFRFK